MAAPQPPPNEETVRLPRECFFKSVKFNLPQFLAKLANQNTIRSQQGVRLRLNAYAMDVHDAPEQIYEFRLTFLGRRNPPANQPQAQQRVHELARRPRNE